MVFEKKHPVRFEAFTSEIVRSVNDNTRRIRILEQGLEGVRSRTSALEEKVIDEVENIKKWLDQLSVDVKDVSKKLTEIHSEILKINKELDKTARKTELKEIESLLELYNPIKSQFVTADQVRRMLEEVKKKV
ncbi:MAG: hypothetical protein DRP62_06725 [Planctomycetota bacterium]|nr:MAG: hypothetical protein DRP62_06725 [Planctomycetota bacterium]